MQGSKLTAAVLLLLAVVGFGGVLLQRNRGRALQVDAAELLRRSRALESRNQVLQKGNEDLTANLRLTHDQLVSLQDQLDKSRQPAAATLPSSSAEKAAPSQEEILQKMLARATDDPRTVAFSPGKLYSGLLAQKDWGFSGRATPADAFQTEMWALREKNYAVYAKGWVFGGQTRELSDASFSQLSENLRHQYGTVENLSATLMYYPALRGLFEGFQIVGQGESDQSRGAITLDIIIQQPDGLVRHLSRTYAHDVDGDWKQLYQGNMIQFWKQTQGSHGRGIAGGPFLFDEDPAPSDGAGAAPKEISDMPPAR